MTSRRTAVYYSSQVDSDLAAADAAAAADDDDCLTDNCYDDKDDIVPAGAR